MKISIVRGAFTNPFELQNYYSLAKKNSVTVYSSQFPISTNIKLPLKRLWSPTDLPLPYKYQILNRLIPDAHYLLGLERAITGSDITHVAETYYHYTLQAIKACDQGRVKKVISTVWEVIPHNNETLPGRKMIKEYVRPRIDHFIAVTQVAKDALIAEGVGDSRTSVIPMGIDTDRFHPSITIRQKAVNILFVGRLVPEKGVGELLQSFEVLKKQIKNLTLTMIGDGPMRNKCLRAGAKVISIPYSQIHKQYAKADIFCLPTQPTATWVEQYGMVLVEALSCGLPIVTSSLPVTREVCGDSALYALPGDSLQLTNQLHYLLTNLDSRRQLRKSARRRALALYDYRKVSAKISKLYQRLLTSKN